MRAFPFIEKIGAINLGMIVGAGVVHPKCAGRAKENGLGVARVKRSLETRYVKHVVEGARVTIDRHPIVEHAVVAEVAKRVGRSATSVLDSEDELRIPGRRQRPGNLGADPAQSVGTEETTIDQG